MPLFTFQSITPTTTFISSVATPTGATSIGTSVTIAESGVTFTVSHAIDITTGPMPFSGMVTVFVSASVLNGVNGRYDINPFNGSVTDIDARLTISFETTPARTAWNLVSVSGTLDRANLSAIATVDGNAIRFTQSNADSMSTFSLEALNVTFACFCAGTLIRTVEGERPIEELEPGVRLRLADGGETRVHWLGRQRVSKTFADPRRVNPICIKAGALGNARDLLVSPDHGIALGGYLVNASALVNGETITQVAEMPGDFTYYHVETEAHELILAEGVATESYLDRPSRAVFDNGQERANAAMIEAMDLPRISSARLLPVQLCERFSGMKAA